MQATTHTHKHTDRQECHWKITKELGPAFSKVTGKHMAEAARESRGERLCGTTGCLGVHMSQATEKHLRMMPASKYQSKEHKVWITPEHFLEIMQNFSNDHGAQQQENIWKLYLKLYET